MGDWDAASQMRLQTRSLTIVASIRCASWPRCLALSVSPIVRRRKIAFIGRDPIVKNPLPLATMAAVGLMAKAVSVADLWRFRGGTGEDLSVNLGQVLHRLCPSTIGSGNC